MEPYWLGASQGGGWRMTGASREGGGLMGIGWGGAGSRPAGVWFAPRLVLGGGGGDP